jgi:hypothetical protein
VMAAAYFLTSYTATYRIRDMILYLLSINAAVLIKPVFIAFPVVSIAIVLIVDQKNTWKSLMLHLIPVIVITAITMVNGKKTGYFEYSSIARKLSVNYHAFYSSTFNEGKDKALERLEKVERHCSDENNYHDKACCIQAGASRIITANMGAYIFLTAKGFLNFFIDHSRYDLEFFFGVKPNERNGLLWHYRQRGINGVVDYILTFNPLYSFYLILSVLINLLLLAGFVLFIFDKKADIEKRIILSSFVLYVAVMTGMSGTTRFRMPVFLLLLAANAISGRISFLKKAKSATGS